MYVKCVCCDHLWTDFEGRVSVFLLLLLLYAYRVQKREQYKRKKSAHYCLYVHKICSYPFTFNVSFYISCWMHMLPFKSCFSIYTIHNTMWAYVFSLTFKCNLSGPFWTLFSLLTTCYHLNRMLIPGVKTTESESEHHKIHKQSMIDKWPFCFASVQIYGIHQSGCNN